MRALRCVLIPCLLWVGTACSEPDPQASRVIVRDSSSVRILETTASARFAADRRVGAAPEWSVGEVEGDPDYLLSRVVGAIQLADGRIVVANGGTNDLRIYDTEGRLAQTIGREGQGPGEFQYLRDLKRCREAGFVAFDLDWQVSAFGADGSFLGRTVIPTPDGFTPYTLECDRAGRFALLGWGRNPSAPPQVGFHALHDRLLLVSLGEGTEADLGMWLVSERIGSPGGSRPHPAGRATVFALHEDKVYLGSGERFEVEVRDLSGRLEQLIRGPRIPLVVTDSLKSLTLEIMLRDADPARHPALRAAVAEWDWPERMPAYTALEVDPEGVVWTRGYSADPLEGETWSLFDPERGYLGDIRLEPGQSLLEAGPDYVLVLSRDELGVERVQRYSLVPIDG